MDPISNSQKAIGPEARATNHKSLVPPKAKVDTGVSGEPEPYSEFGKIPVLKEPKKKTNTIAVNERDLSVGKARYKDAVHLSKYVAVKPNYIAGGGDLMTHSNVEVHLYNNDGKEVPMTERYVRQWDFNVKDPTVRIANLKKTDLEGVPANKRGFYRESPSVEDAPGQQNIKQGKNTVVSVQEFVTGNPVAGGFYFQLVNMLDPDGATRQVYMNRAEISKSEYKSLTKIINDPKFESEYENRFVISNLRGTVQQDSGIDRTIPDIVKRKKGK